MAAKDFSIPDRTAVVDEEQNITVKWLEFFSRIFTLSISLQASGATADRPTKGLWVGRCYFDTTLGHEIWLKSAGPDVWVDGVGTAV